MLRIPRDFEGSADEAGPFNFLISDRDIAIIKGVHGRGAGEDAGHGTRVRTSSVLI